MAKDEQVISKKAMIKGRDELILLADDNRLLRLVTEEILIDLKFRVVSAVDGEDALELYQKHKNEISLVILDIVMPKMNGLDAAVKIHQLDSTMPVIFTTGQDKEGTLAAQQKIRNSVVLNKPFSVERLSETINQLLDL